MYTMNYKRLFLMSMCLGALTLPACSHSPRPQAASLPEPVSADASLQRGEIPVLAGEWEYEEGGMVVPLRLDRFGDGSYDFKDGRFRTKVVLDHRWEGAWAQRENDREGGFEITLSSDFSEGDGHWWYTRIEGDTAPKKVGGRFHVMKVQSLVGNRLLPAEPASQ